MTIEEKRLLALYRMLPDGERAIMFRQATGLVERAVAEFVKLCGEQLDDADQVLVLETVFGRLSGDPEEILAQGSKFTQAYNNALIAAVIEIMKQRDNAPNN